MTDIDLDAIEARANAMLKDTGYYDKGTDFCSKVAKICIGVAALIAEIRRLREELVSKEEARERGAVFPEDS